MSRPQFPIDLSAYHKVSINPWKQKQLTPEQEKQIKENIELCRDAIVTFTATAAGKGYGGHTGGPYDTVPEVMLLDAMFRGCPDEFVTTFFDEAGHRVATQYLMSVLEGSLEADRLLDYRVGHGKLPGHPELGLTPGVKFSSGRLGHMWPFVNGVSLGNPDKVTICLGSDGSQMEGNDAEAARLAVAKHLNVKLFIDDNDVTISGHPSKYLQGYNVGKTLQGHGLTVFEADGEDLHDLYRCMRNAITMTGPVAVITKRVMCVGVEGMAGTIHAHDAMPVDKAIPFLEKRGQKKAVEWLKSVKPAKDPYQYKSIDPESKKANRVVFGEAMVKIMQGLSPEQLQNVLVFDCDLEGSTGLKAIHQNFPERFVAGGVMERGNLSAAAGFGFGEGKQGVFSTFSAFLEMVISEATMARLNQSNVLCHFSHAGVDDMADNTCHFGLNNLFADSGLEEIDNTRVYFPCDANQMTACLEAIFHDPGLRFVFSTRSKVPIITDTDGKGGKPLFAEGYKFRPGKDDIIREGKDGYIVSYGDELYRCLEAVHILKEEGIEVGLICKATLNVVDEEMMAKIGKSPFVMVAESLSRKTGLGSRFGTWLLERGFHPKYSHHGSWKEGCGGLFEHMPHQELDPESIVKKVKALRG